MRLQWVFPILVLLNYAVPYTLLANRPSPISIIFWIVLIIAAILVALFSSMRWKDEE